MGKGCKGDPIDHINLLSANIILKFFIGGDSPLQNHNLAASGDAFLKSLRASTFQVTIFIFFFVSGSFKLNNAIFKNISLAKILSATA